MIDPLDTARIPTVEPPRRGPGFGIRARLAVLVLAALMPVVALITAHLVEHGDVRGSVIVAALTVLVALLAALLVAGRISRPIQVLTADAHAIASGDFTHRTAVAVGGELGMLARQFNGMAETIERQTRILRESEERYRELFELSPLPMWLFDDDTLRFLAVNDAAVRLYGWSRDEFLAMDARDIRPAADIERFEAQVRRRTAEGITQERVRHRVRDGQLLDVDVTSSRTMAFGRPAWLSVVSDITQRERTEAELRASQDQLRQMQKIDAVGSLAAGIAHDFNNLLTGILGGCDLALYSLPNSHPAYEEIKHARDAALRATDLTRRLLTFSRQQASAPVHINVCEVIRGMQPLLTRTLGEHVKLDLRLDRAPCTVLADPGQIEQIILNLLVNARDAMPDGGTVITDARAVTLTESRDGMEAGRWIQLTVTDHGTGMDATTAARVFEPFFTTKARGKGTGLGLSVVYSAARNAGGHVRLETAPDAGATFRVWLPFHESAAPRKVTPAGGTPVAVGVETILLVEDDDAVRRVTARMLEGLGYRVLSSPGPRHALDLARDHIGSLDLVFTDVVMPGMNGREMVEAMGKLRPRLKVVYASGYTDDLALLQELRKDALFFLQKPFVADSLGRMVRIAIDAPAQEP